MLCSHGWLVISEVTSVIPEWDFLTSPPRASHSLCWSFPRLLTPFFSGCSRWPLLCVSHCKNFGKLALCGSPGGPSFFHTLYRAHYPCSTPNPGPGSLASTYFSLCISGRADFVVWKSSSCEYRHSCCGNSSCIFLFILELSVYIGLRNLDSLIHLPKQVIFTKSLLSSRHFICVISFIPHIYPGTWVLGLSSFYSCAQCHTAS